METAIEMVIIEIERKIGKEKERVGQSVRERERERAAAVTLWSEHHFFSWIKIGHFNLELQNAISSSDGSV